MFVLFLFSFLFSASVLSLTTGASTQNKFNLTSLCSNIYYQGEWKINNYPYQYHSSPVSFKADEGWFLLSADCYEGIILNINLVDGWLVDDNSVQIRLNLSEMSTVEDGYSLQTTQKLSYLSSIGAREDKY